MDNKLRSDGDLAEVLGGIAKGDESALKGIFALPPAQFSLLSSVLALLFVEGLDLGQQNSLGNFIVGIGQTILVAAAQGQLIQENSDPTAQMQRQIQALKKQVDCLEHQIGRH